MVVKFTTLLHIFSLYAVTKCDEDTKETQHFRNFTKLHDISPDIMLIMLDASGKPPSGLLKGNHYSLGNFDECYEIVDKTIGDNITFYGKYCLGSGKVRNFDVSTGVCIPSFMTAEQISGNYKFTEDLCYSQDTRPELPTGAIYTIVVISLFLIGVAASTICHIIHRYSGKSNGPFWNKYASDDKINCEDCWWTDLLFIGNYVKNKFCMTMVWYLAADMQLFILSPLILLPLSKWHKQSLVVLVILIILGCVSPIIQGIVSKLHVVEKSHYFTTYYIKTHTRFGPYVIGILFGYLLLKKTETNIKNLLHLILIMIVWTTCIALLFVCLYAGHDMENYTEYDFWATVWLMGISHPLWSFVVGTIILLCASGLGGPINSFLSLPIFSFLAKLSYAMYLLQFHAMLPRTLSIKHASTFSPVSSIVSFWGDFMVILAMSVVLFLAIEAPVDSVYQQFVRRLRRKKTASV